MSTRQKEIIEAIKNIALAGTTPLFSRVSEKKVSQSDAADTELPALLISEINTTFSKQQRFDVVENYEIKMIILLEDCEDPLDKLSEKQTALIKALFADSTLSFLINKDGIGLLSSNISNAVSQFSYGSAVSCVLSVTCSAVVSYNP